jgi:SSS family solute:Na+ symporter
MNAVIAIGIIAAVLAITLALGAFGVRRVAMDPEQYIVGGRSFGALFLWLLLAGEIYTSFTFLGAAGWAYGRGAPAFYILCYGTIAYILSYFLLPPIWRLSQRNGFLTGPDFFVHQYRSPWLGALVALVGFVFLIPYATLQLTGVQVLLTIAGYGTINTLAAVGIAFALIALFVFGTGLRGAAWASTIKDGMVLIGVIFAGIVLPIRFFGSPAGVIDAVLAQRPHWMTLTGDASANGVTWFVSTVILTALGFYMWPQSLAAVYSAKDEDTLRRNSIALPVYQLMLLLVYFAGFTALLVLPGLKGPAADQSFMLVVQRYYSPWILGFVAAAGCLAGLVPASVQILAAASIVAKNILGDTLGIATTNAAQTRATRILVLLVASFAFLFWALAKTTLVGLLLISYNGITQLFPGVALSFARTRPSAVGIAAGILAGIAALTAFALRGTSVVGGVNVGLAALGLNAVVAVVVGYARPIPSARGDQADAGTA